MEIEQVRRHPQTLSFIFAWRGQIQQVFINVSPSRLGVIPDGGALQVCWKKIEHKINLKIKDTDSSIQIAIGCRIFESSFTIKQPGQRLGWGLAVSYGIVRKHGGAIDFTSHGNRCTVLTIELPILQHQPGG